MSNFDINQIPDHAMHEAVRKTLSDCKLTGGNGTIPYNFRCPICGDSKKNPHKKRGYVTFNKGPWVYTCHNECGKMSFLSFLKQYHPIVHRELMFMALTDKGGSGRKNYTEKKSLAEKSYTANNTYKFKKGELIEINSSHPLAKTAIKYCQSRRIPKKVYSRWFVCIKNDKFHDRDNNGNLIYNEKGIPKGNEYANRLIIPYYKFGGKFVQFDARSLEENAFLRYRNLEGADRELYMYEWLDTSKPFFLVEGSIDATFIKNCVAFGGTQHLMKFLDMYPEIKRNSHNGTVIWDNDDAGKDEMPKTIKLGFNWFDWDSIKPLPKYKYDDKGDERIIKDINNMVMYTDAINVDNEGFVVTDSLIKYIKKPDGIIATMRYGNRDKMKKERNKKKFNEMNKRRNKQKQNNWFLG